MPNNTSDPYSIKSTPFWFHMTGLALLLACGAAFIYSRSPHPLEWVTSKTFMSLFVVLSVVGTALVALRRETLIHASDKKITVHLRLLLSLTKKEYPMDAFSRILSTWSGPGSTAGAGSQSRPSYSIHLLRHDKSSSLEILETHDPERARSVALEIAEHTGIRFEDPSRSQIQAKDPLEKSN